MPKLIIILASFLLITVPITVGVNDFPKLNSSTFILYDYTDNSYLYANNSTEKRSIASLTKILTAITAINIMENNNIDYNKRIIINDKMISNLEKNVSIAGLRSGDIVSYKDLLYALILSSGADAANSLAISLTGSVDDFVRKMNETALDIGLSNSTFNNVIGLDDTNHYSTANDIMKLIQYGMNNQEIQKILKTKKYTLSSGLPIKSTILLYDENLKIDTTRILGGKTGFTNNAGNCLISLFKSGNHEYILLTMGAPYSQKHAYHIDDAIRIIKFLDETNK